MIIISPYSRPLRNGVKPNPKDYPYFQELIEMILKEYPKQTIIQVGVHGEEKFDNTNILFGQSLQNLKNLLNICDVWISVDNFFHHLASTVGKKGIVIFGPSDPIIFGNTNNVNLLKSRKHLREKQFEWYENTRYNKEAFIEPEIVMGSIRRILNEQLWKDNVG